MLKMLIALLLVVSLAAFYATPMKFLVLKNATSTSFDIDGDGKNDVKVETLGGEVSKVEFEGREVKAKFESGKVNIELEGEKIEIKSPNDIKRIEKKVKEIKEEQEKRKEEIKEREEKKEEREKVQRREKKIEKREIEEEGGKIFIGKENVTIFMFDLANNETFVNSNGNEKFDMKISQVGNESVVYEDKDEDGEGDVALLLNGRASFDIENNLLTIDLNRNGIKDAIVDLNTWNYSLNYVELAAFLGKDFVSILRSGNFTPEAIEEKLLEILAKKDPELYRFVLSHKNDFLQMLEEIRKNARIEESAIFSFTGFSSPEDAIRTYYSLVCSEKSVAGVFSPVVDRSTVEQLHNAVYEAFDYSNCEVSGINCTSIEFAFGGDKSNYTLCRYMFKAKVKDRKGREMQIDKEFETLLDKNNLLIWTRGVGS